MDEPTFQSHSDSDEEGASKEGRRSLQRYSKRRELASVNQVLTKLVNKLGLDRRLKEHALMSMWPTVVPNALALKSRPLFLDSEGSVVVAVADASAGQELSLLKMPTLNKLQALAKGLGVTVKGLRFELKHYHNKEEQYVPQFGKAQVRPTYTEEELSYFTLTNAELAEIAQLRADLEAQESTSPEMADKILFMYERELRLKLWRRSRGMPPCPNCKEPAESLHGQEALCKDCYFESMAAVEKQRGGF